MPTTPNHGLRYPDGTDPLDVQGDMAKLALDTDAAIPAVMFGAGQPGPLAAGERALYFQVGPPAAIWLHYQGQWVSMTGGG